MADYVREIMEKMVNPLRDLQQNEIFTEKELASIVDRREGFEYGLKKRQVDKVCLLFVCLVGPLSVQRGNKHLSKPTKLLCLCLCACGVRRVVVLYVE